MTKETVLTIRLLAFGALSDHLGNRPIEMSLATGSRVSDLLVRVGRDYPAAESQLPHCMVAVNREYVAREYVLAGGDEVALLPPVSGG